MFRKVTSDGDEVFELGTNDAAVCFREDGKMELSIPNGPDSMEIGQATMSVLLVVVLFSGRPEVENILSELNEIATRDTSASSATAKHLGGGRRRSRTLREPTAENQAGRALDDGFPAPDEGGLNK